MDAFKFRSKWIVFFVIAVSYTASFHTIDAASTRVYSKVCQTEACRNIANSILRKMNQKANPCNNFYEFVCGNFSKNSEIPATRSSNDLFVQLTDLVQIQLKNSIENKITANDPEAFQKLLTYYKTCMDEDQIERTSSNELLRIMKKLGGWPVLLGKSYRDSKFDWTDAIKKISKIGYSRNYFFSMDIANDLRDSTRNLLYLDQPVLATSQEYLSKGLENDVVKAYFKYMVDVAEIFGANREEAKLELAESLNFEVELAKISLSKSQRRNIEKLYNPMTISEVQSKYPYIPWLRYLNDQLSPFVRLSEDETVIVTAPSFFASLGDLLARTPKRVLANYALWRVAYASSTQLSGRVLDAYREFRASLTGNRNRTPRWQSCVSYASGSLYLATSALYVRRYFDKASKDGVVDMVKRLRQSFRTILLSVQ